MNESALATFNQQLNSYANVRDFLMTFTNTLAITTVNSVKMQASSLSQLTQSTNQLTRSALIIASDKSFQLAIVLRSMATKVPYEDVQSAATSITQCATNVLTVSEMMGTSRNHLHGVIGCQWTLTTTNKHPRSRRLSCQSPPG